MIQEEATMRYFVTLALIFAASAGHAISPEAPGEPVQNIPQADRIVDWTAVDGQRVLVNNAQNSYLLTLKHQCHGLAWAQNVTVSMSNNTIWAGFDKIQADGLQCPIDRIWRLGSGDTRLLTN
jgi:hypothetical protein